jgi:hypothetical protein
MYLRTFNSAYVHISVPVYIEHCIHFRCAGKILAPISLPTSRSYLSRNLKKGLTFILNYLLLRIHSEVVKEALSVENIIITLTLYTRRDSKDILIIPARRPLYTKAT